MVAVESSDHELWAVYGAEAPPPARTLVDIFESTVARHPDAMALEGTTGGLTYRELSVQVQECAASLRTAGVLRGDRVGVRVPSGTLDLYIAILGVLQAGAAYVPVDWDDPDERAETVFVEAEVAAVLGEDLEILPRARGGEVTSSDPAGDDGDLRPGLSDDAWVIFTSGSTGTPKGVAVSHRSAAALVDVEADLYLAGQPLGPGDRVMAGLSVAFDASCEEMWLAWRSGATLVAAPREIVRSGPDLGRWIVDQRITAVSTVPTLASLWPVEALDDVRLLIFGGEACPMSLVDRLSRPGRELWNTYGPTEATVIACGAVLTPDQPVRIGRPIDGWQLAVVDPSSGEPVRWGEEGELVIAGVGLGRYLDQERDAVQYAPLPSLGWERAYRTGDVVRAEHEGLVFVGRTDDQIKFGGVRIELDEIDEHLTQMPGVNMGASALRTTEAGTDVLVGYLAPQPGAEIDLATVRPLLAQRLPGGVLPVLVVVDELPMRTSGKIDRSGLPWPLPDDADADDADLSATESWLKGLWVDQLGPLPIASDTNFFDLGGGSVQVARLVATIRDSYPAAEIRELYGNPSLARMASYIDTLRTDTVSRPLAEDDHTVPGALPVMPRVFQAAFVLGAYALNAIRYVVALVAVVWALGFLVGASWVPWVPFLPVLIAWVLLFSLPGRVLQAAVVARVMTLGLRPGTYPRGGWVHVRLWAAERFLEFLQLEPLCGTTFSRTFHRLMGCRVGARSHVACLPPVSGLVTIGDDATVEFEADLAGHWIEGGVLHVGTVTVGDGARVGARSVLGPGAVVGTDAEVKPGSYVDRDIPAGELWGGSPIIRLGVAGESWPLPRRIRRTPSGPGVWRPSILALAEAMGLTILVALPIVAMIPSALLILPRLIDVRHFDRVAFVLAAWTPVIAVVTVLTWLAMVIVLVRILASWIVPGYFQESSAAGWAVWLTRALLQRTLISTYPLYASLATPTFLRLLGARVGQDTEISTIETVPHLTWLQDRTFIADHALITSTRHRHGWVHIGTTVIGEGAFIGNSAIVGPDVDLPTDSLVAVLSTPPRRAPAGSSWLGRPPQEIPRTVASADTSLTYRPTPRIRAARTFVEIFRIVPFMIAIWIELGLVFILNTVYMRSFVETGSQLAGLRDAALAALPLTLLAGLVAVAVAVGAKWMLLGRFREGESPLFSSFVWRNELADVFAESLAVPTLVRLSIGSGLFNVYARLMGVRIGRDVWCETWWLPEFDLVTIDDRATINRGTVLQTHLFQDRVMTRSRTMMGVDSTLGPHSFILPGSSIGDRTVVAGGSLVLRDEQLPADTAWQGNPVRFLHRGWDPLPEVECPQPEPTTALLAEAAR